MLIASQEGILLNRAVRARRHKQGTLRMTTMGPVAVNFAVGPRMMLRSGAWFDFLDPRSSDFDIDDIAHGLAHVCRYAGQCTDFYSVAEHSLLVSDTCREDPYAALMHDAAEALIGDVTRPLKQLLPDYKRLEREVEAAVFERFGVAIRTPNAVKAADLRVLAAEQAQIMPKGTADWAVQAGISPAPVFVRHLAPSIAKQAFLDRFHALRDANLTATCTVASRRMRLATMG